MLTGIYLSRLISSRDALGHDSDAPRACRQRILVIDTTRQTDSQVIVRLLLVWEECYSVAEAGTAPAPRAGVARVWLGVVISCSRSAVLHGNFVSKLSVTDQVLVSNPPLQGACPSPGFTSGVGIG
jgi:hypothetical protein